MVGVKSSKGLDTGSEGRKTSQGWILTQWMENFPRVGCRPRGWKIFQPGGNLPKGWILTQRRENLSAGWKTSKGLAILSEASFPSVRLATHNLICSDAAGKFGLVPIKLLTTG